MLRYLYAFFFGCFHTRTTFPMTMSSRSPVNGEVRRRTYVACLTCGEEFAYNWDKMKVEGRSSALRQPSPAVVVSITRESPALYERLLPADNRALTQAGR